MGEAVVYSPLGSRGGGLRIGVVALVTGLVLTALLQGATGPADPPAGRGPAELLFVPNRGQVDDRVAFQATAGSFAAFFMEDRARFAFTRKEGRQTLDLRFVGGADAQPHGAGRQRAVMSYFGDGQGQSGLPTYGHVTYRELWPGIDMVFRGVGGKLEYAFVLRPGANPRKIRLAWDGAEAVRMGRTGDLLLHTPLGVLEDTSPRAWQEQPGGRTPVQSRFALDRRNGQFGVEVDRYDRRRPLIIDPGLEYGTYLGGFESDAGQDIAVDRHGAAYVTGLTRGDFPTGPGYDQHFEGHFEAFVAKLSPSGSALEYGTYLGGGHGDGIAVDEDGNAYITGTADRGFPTTPGAFKTTSSDNWDSFAAKLDPTGTQLLYSTLIGGSSVDYISEGVDVDESGHAYIEGFTMSRDFPTTSGAYDRTYSGGAFDAFVVKVSPDGSELAFSTLLGGSGHDEARDLALDPTGGVVLTGTSASADFPATPGALGTTFSASAPTSYLAKLSSDGSSLEYSTALGGPGDAEAVVLAVDGNGNAYVGGQTASADFPATADASDTTLGGEYDAFVAKIADSGTRLAYATFLGGSGREFIDFVGSMGMAVDARGRAYLAGDTQSADFPTTAEAYDRTFGGGDGFASVLSARGDALVHSTFVSSPGRARGIAVDAAGDAYVTGIAGQHFTTTPGAYDTTPGGFTGDAFVAKLDLAPGPPADLTLTPSTATNTVGSSHCATAAVTDGEGAPTAGIAIRFAVQGSIELSETVDTDAEGRAVLCYAGPDLPGDDTIEAYADTDGDSRPDAGEPRAIASKRWVPPASTPGCSAKGVARITTTDDSPAEIKMNLRTSKIRPSGSFLYRDRRQALTVRSLSVDVVVCQPDGKATVFGRTAGTSGHYRIDVTDGGRQGGGDRFRIRLSDGYDSGMVSLDSGDLRVRG